MLVLTEGQRTTLRFQFSPPALWASGVELSLSDVCAECLYLLLSLFLYAYHLASGSIITLDSVLLHSLVWPRICYVGQDGLKPRDLPYLPRTESQEPVPPHPALRVFFLKARNW